MRGPAAGERRHTPELGGLDYARPDDGRARDREDRSRRGRGGGRKGGGQGGGWFDRIIRRVVLWTLGMALRLGLVFVVVLGAAVWMMHASLPEPERLLDGRDRGSVTMFDRNGEVFAWRGDQFGGEVRVADVSPHLVHAILAVEDRRFFSHPGVDARGLLRAALVNMRAGAVVQGGSTITQQVAKNVFLTDERSIERKLKEIPMALAMELKFDKEDILAVYLNRVYLGAGAYGFEAAAQRYFGKSAAFLNPAEAAMLAGLLKAPSRFSPTADIARAQARAALVVTAMEEEGYLTPAQAAEARANPAQLSSAAAARAGGHFADWVMESGPAWLTRASTEDVLIRTTFDPAAQTAAEQALAHVFETSVREGSAAQAAIVVMTPDGAVRAIVGGRNAAGGFNRATQAKRQTGSAFKPFIYAAAMERGFSPEDVMIDAPLTMGNWSPQNFGGEFAGPVTLTQALARSINTVAVRLSEQVGRENVRAMARKLGLSTPLAEGPAVALGVSEATLIEMTGAYAAFASGGFDGRPWAIRDLRLRGDADPLMTGGEGPRRRLLDHRVAGLTTHMLAEAVRNGTGGRARLPDREAAGKTGTTQAARDAWFVGYTAQYVVGVWMGYDDNTPLTGVTGGGLPAAIWRETMTRLHRGLPAQPLPEIRPEPRYAAPPLVAQSEAASDDETLLGSILSDVVRRLGGN
ncbi:MAG: transglycosylase domain-containing protein [Rubrimonas sp.]